MDLQVKVYLNVDALFCIGTIVLTALDHNIVVIHVFNGWIMIRASKQKINAKEHTQAWKL